MDPLPDSPPPRWSVEQRTAFAARRLFWDGAINREDLIARFGVSANQATADIARLREAHPGALVYDTTAKTYRADPSFAPPEAAPAALLRELRLVAEGHLSAVEATLKAIPLTAIAELPERTVDAAVLKTLIHAIRDNKAVAGHYVSFQRPGTSRRLLSPHALVFDGFRWHVRAYDAGDNRWKDFVIARLSDAAQAGEQQQPASADNEWHRFITLEIAPNPGLGPHQRQVVASDYGMIRQRLRIQIRQAMLFYVKRRFGLEPGHEQRPPKDQHIVLVREVLAPSSIQPCA